MYFKSKKHKVMFLSNLAVIIFGGAFLIWYYLIDGKLVNQPIVYTHGVDPHNLQVDKELYKVGETPYVYTAFCKTRDAKGSIEWTLVDGQQVSYGPKPATELPSGCYPVDNSSGFLKSEVAKLPYYLESTCNAKFVGVVTREISGGRIVKTKVETEKFCIEGSLIKEIKEITNI